MNLEALTLLETPTVRRLVATWPRIKGHNGVDQESVPMEILTKWSRVSGLHAKICRQWLWPLLDNEIIRPDGTIDAAAADYIAQCALSRAKFAVERKGSQKHDA